MGKTDETLRHAMVAALVDSGAIKTDAVADAMRAVPRHCFVPDVALDTAYADVAIPTKIVDGRPVSSASQPAIVAIMLEQLALQPGDRVLEIGAGTGYNAALMAHLVGPSGQVRAIDIDDDIVRGARAHLQAAGVTGVDVVLGDGMEGDPDDAPCDHLIATVGIWDIPPRWWEQLVVGGRLVLPLSLRGPQVSVALNKTGDGVMESASVAPCGFLRLRGPLGRPETVVTAGGVTVTTECDLGPNDIAAALSRAGTVERVGVGASIEDIFGSVALWLAVHADGYCRIDGMWRDDSPALQFAVVMPKAEKTVAWSPAISDGGSLAVIGRDDDEVVVTTLGRPTPASRVADAVRSWHERGRPTSADLRLRVDRLPAQVADGAVVIAKHWTSITARWPGSHA